MKVDEETTQESLAGQVAVVTGGGRGLGRVMAQALAQVGAAVIVVARSEEELDETVFLIEKNGGQASSFSVDVTDQHAVNQMGAEIKQRFGTVDLLVNNAGVNAPIDTILDMDAEVWWRTMEINVRGPLLCTRAFLPDMINQRRGRIINVSSGAGVSPRPYASAYGISKTALNRFSETLAIETKEYGVSVFAIGPGIVRTAMNEMLLASSLFQKHYPQHGEFFAAGHDDPPELAAQLVLFLASGKADALTGRFVTVQDDIAALVNHAKEIQENNLYTLRIQEITK